MLTLSELNKVVTRKIKEWISDRQPFPYDLMGPWKEYSSLQPYTAGLHLPGIVFTEEDKDDFSDGDESAVNEDGAGDKENGDKEDGDAEVNES